DHSKSWFWSSGITFRLCGTCRLPVQLCFKTQPKRSVMD
ncbi:transketolase domain protein, partial [Chlamydia psittaci 02DC14]